MRLRVLASASWTVLGICSERGECEVLEFFGELEGRLARDAGRLVKRIEQISYEGVKRGIIETDLLDERRGIYEFIQGDIRVAWFYDEEQLVICSHGFVKKTQKTPRSEIRRACAAADAYAVAKARKEIRIDSEVDE